MTVLARPYIYLDVAGTDRSSLISEVPRVKSELSAVSLAQIKISNHGGSYTSTFSKRQVVSISAARAAFASLSDYFTGTDGAAADAAKWDTTTGGGTTAAISSNKIKLTTNASGNGPMILSDNSFTFPYTLTVYTYSTLNHAADWNTYVYGRRGSDNASWWALAAYNGEWHLLTYWGGAWAQRDVTAGTKYAVNTWYKIIIKRATATTIWVGVYDVFGTAIWEASTSTDTLTSEKVQMGNGASNSSGDTYFDSFLMWGASTPQGEQLFEGYIDEIAFDPANPNSPDSITLNCVGYESELSDQYDDTYGRATATFTPTYGATDDVTAQVTALLPSGWTCKCPDTAIHDKQIVSINTKRLDAINEFLETTPYLGWFVIPPKCLCCVLPDTTPAPDAYTESAVGWTSYGAPTTFATHNTYVVDGAQTLRLAKNAAGTYGAYYTVSFTVTDYAVIHVYYGGNMTGSAWGEIKVYLGSSADPANRHFKYTLPVIYNSPVGPANMMHHPIRLPDANGYHGWTLTGAYFTPVSRLGIEVVGNIANTDIEFDVLYLVAGQRATSKYTISNPISVSRDIRGDNKTRVIVTSTTVTAVVDDATAQSVDGLNELLVVDQSVTSSEPAIAEATNILVTQGYGVTTDPIIAELHDPGDMYNVMLGDTITLSYTNAGLSSAKRTLISREDAFNEFHGWVTRLKLSAAYSELIEDKLLGMSKRKRF